MKRYKLKITPEAHQEIQKAIDYYNTCSKGLGRRFFLDLQDQFTRIKKNPFARAVRYDDVRFALLDRFPYAAHFTIDEPTRTIRVQAVLSQHQDPDTHWKKRE
jgi:plasmid stabilization system protein ParE